MKLAVFDDFVKLANFFYMTIGIEPYHKVSHVPKSKALFAYLIFYGGLINLNVILMTEIVFVIINTVKRENFLEVTMTLSYIGFVIVGNTKMIFIYKKKKVLTKFVGGLRLLFPTTPELQAECNLAYYLKLCSRITISFSGLYMILIWTYNIFSLMQYLVYDLWLHIRHVEQSLPYFMYTPWDWHNHWSYYALYAAQNVAGYTSATGQIASDLLLIAFVTQLVMHYEFAAKKLSNYEVKCVGKGDFAQDMEFLRGIVQFHTQLLHLTDQFNEVFGVPLFLNFAASSFVICFVGFEITIGTTAETIFKLLLFLFSSIAQVYMVCNYGQQLKDASSKIAQAAYNQHWCVADVRYMKMLLLIAKRAQKPARLQATSFVFISRESMAQIMQLSYKFFALLRTMYAES